jgi:hypothetical protein
VVLDNAAFAFDSETVSSSAGSSPFGTLAFGVRGPFADASICPPELVFVGLVTVLDPGVARAFETFAAVTNRPLAPLLNIEYVLRSCFVGVEGTDVSRTRARASDIDMVEYKPWHLTLSFIYFNKTVDATFIRLFTQLFVSIFRLLGLLSLDHCLLFPLSLCL